MNTNVDANVKVIKDSLVKMEAASIASGTEFLTHKLKIQDALGKLAANPPAGFELKIKEMFFDWRQLGTSKGTLRGYMSAISDLKKLIVDLMAL